VSDFHHIPVLLNEVIEGLTIPQSGRYANAGGWYLDATCGGGGHSEAILKSHEGIKLVAIDRDDDALAAARQRLAGFGNRVVFVKSNFADYRPPAGLLFQGILADIGVSSTQLDIADRGFSFRQTAPLDMRMDRTQNLTAEKIVNTWQEEALAKIIFEFGEERLSRRIAKRIVENRPFETTTQLAEAIFHSVPRAYRYGRIHPATRTFQALRIAVNGELESLRSFLDNAPNWLVKNGRIAIISFHSLEDRIVKNNFRDRSDLKNIVKKPIIATEAENSLNPRARSAKLRIAERIVN
jgi:16S rRNA (cytosine1402-N4)-methyltransferase